MLRHSGKPVRAQPTAARPAEHSGTFWNILDAEGAPSGYNQQLARLQRSQPTITGTLVQILPAAPGRGSQPLPASRTGSWHGGPPPLLLVGTPPFGEEGGVFLSKLGQVGPSLKAPREG